MSITVLAHRDHDQQLCGLALCGLEKGQIEHILGVLVGTEVLDSKTSTPIRRFDFKTRANRRGQSFLFHVGDPYGWSREAHEIEEAKSSKNKKDDDHLVTGPSGFCMAVSSEDEECIRALRLLDDAFTHRPSPRRKGLRQECASSALRRSVPSIREWLEAVRMSVLCTGFEASRGERNRKLIVGEWRDHAREVFTSYARYAHIILSRKVVGFGAWCKSLLKEHSSENHSQICVELGEVNGQPAILFKVRYLGVTPLIKNFVRRLRYEWKPQLLPAPV